MAAPPYEVGDLVHSRIDIFNDGGVPDVPEGSIVAAAGTRGVIVRAATGQGRRSRLIYLVRFEGSDLVLGPTVSCLEEELTQDPSDCHGGSSDEGPP